MIPRLRHHLVSDFVRVRQHWRAHGTRTTLAWLGSLDSPVSVQFLKYVVFGGIASIVHLGIFAGLSHTVFPAHDYLAVGELAGALKQRNAIISNLFAFPVAASVNYLFNIAFIFTAGRHSRIREFTLFFVVSLASLAAGLLCGPFLISHGLNPWIAQGGLMVSSTLVNFLCRKFFVFLR
jgi:putative flippase GtrA